MHHLEGNGTAAAVFLKTAIIEGNYGALPSVRLYTVICHSNDRMVTRIGVHTIFRTILTICCHLLPFFTLRNIYFPFIRKLWMYFGYTRNVRKPDNFRYIVAYITLIKLANAMSVCQF